MTTSEPNRMTRDEIEAKYNASQPTTANPHTRTILFIWVVALNIGAVLFLIGLSTDDLLKSLIFSVIGSSFLSLAIMGAMIHLAVKAIRWKAPVDS